MKTFKRGDVVRLTAKAKRLSDSHQDWWSIDPATVARIKKLNLFTVSEVNYGTYDGQPTAYFELAECQRPWSWNPKLFTKRGIH